MAGIDTYSKLVLHCDGVDTTFTDSSLAPKTINSYGGATQSATEKKFGAKSAYFDGSNDRLYWDYDSDFNLSSGDFTIDLWFNASGFGSTQYLFAKDYYGSYHDYSISILSSTQIRLWTNYGSSTLTATVPTMSTGTWYHVAVVKNGSRIDIYLDGTSYANSSSMTMTNNPANHLCIGCSSHDNNANGFFAGYIDEVRFSKGIARWTSNFTPPSEAYSAVEVEGEITSSCAIGDSIDVVNLGESLLEAFVINDSLWVSLPKESVSAGSGLGDSISGGIEYQDSIGDDSALGDSVDAGFEFELDNDSGVAIGDSVDAFNWGRWHRENASQLTRLFYFTLTGDPDGESDAIIPISSFSFRRRNDEPSYLSVVVPGFDYAGVINDRLNGEMVLEIVYEILGSEALREEVIRVDFEEIRTDEGTRSKSITLAGHRTEAWAGQICEPKGVSYKSLSASGKWTVRSDLEPYVRPGDTIRIDGVDLFEAGMVSAYASPGRGAMEITEA